MDKVYLKTINTFHLEANWLMNSPSLQPKSNAELINRFLKACRETCPLLKAFHVIDYVDFVQNYSLHGSKNVAN